jgi:hypothetical protein
MTTRRGLHGECAVRDTFGAMDRSGTGARNRRTVHRESKTWEKVDEVSKNLSDRDCYVGYPCRPRIGARRRI